MAASPPASYDPPTVKAKPRPTRTSRAHPYRETAASSSRVSHSLTSRMESNPTRRSWSSTGKCRNPFVRISRIASSTVVEGATCSGFCHDTRYGCRFRIESLVDDPDEDVPLRKDTDQLAVIDYRQSADLEFTHYAYRCGDRV